jgi:hypothetical protein
VYRWDFDGLARQEFDDLSAEGQAAITAIMNAAVLVDPIEYQRHAGEPIDPPKFIADRRERPERDSNARPTA